MINSLPRVHVDRTAELELFTKMIGGEGTAHTLLIEAEPGMGKSALLRELWDHAQTFPRMLVDLKPSSLTVQRILTDLCQVHGTPFTRFAEQQQTSAVPVGIQINDNKIVGSSLDIRVPSADAEQRETRTLLLTNAFFEDLAEHNGAEQTTVIIFDTFERAAPEVRDWLSGLFLTRARSSRWLVTVVAGQQIPEPGIGWDDWCIQQTLRPLNREHVQEWASRVHLDLSEDEIAILYDTSEGIPLDLSTSLGRLVLKRRAGNGPP
jgi:hypothetical protein